MKRLFFRSKQRLISNTQFKSVLSHKCCSSNSLCRLYIAENNLDFPRLGISIGRKYGNAVARNRIKRVVREVFRTEQHNIVSNYDYLLIFSPKMSKKAVAADDFRKIFLNLAERALNKAKK